jgi:DNA-binding LacI/PurR family transcriptional regulator
MAVGKTGEVRGLKALAKLAGVSPATVSRVINDRPGVRPELRQAVEQAIRQHGLNVDSAARALKSRKTQRLAIITPRQGSLVFANPFFTEIFRGITSITEQRGYVLAVTTSATAQTLHEVNRNRSCDGVLFIGFRKSIPDPRSLKGATVPVVTIPRPGPQYRLPYVTMEDEAGAYEATGHLIQRGHRRIALLNGPRTSIYSINRLAGYRRALADAAIPFDPTLVVDGDFDHDGACRATLQLLDMDAPPTAIFATSDFMALGATRGVYARGLTIPRDIALVGFGNTPVCTHVSPALTSVDEQLQELGAQAATLLIRLAEGEPVETTQIALPTKLVVRESS